MTILSKHFIDANKKTQTGIYTQGCESLFSVLMQFKNANITLQEIIYIIMNRINMTLVQKVKLGEDSVRARIFAANKALEIVRVASSICRLLDQKARSPKK